MSIGQVSAVIGLAYFVGLFALAYYADELERRGKRNLADNPWVYSLSLAIYCTSWAFYGSVGRVATNGPDFLAVYIGPTLVFILAPLVIKKITAVSKEHGVTNVPDLLEALYGKSRTLGAIAALLLIYGVTPYIGLQLKAIAQSYNILIGRASDVHAFTDAAFWAALSIGFFAILFGARSLVASERHVGLVTAMAFESVVKLIAFLALGVYVVWGIGGGLGEVMARATADPATRELLTIGGKGGSVAQWLSLCVLSASAVILLPRQFHMLVVENQRDSHIRHASWSFPLYLLLINLLVIPVALVGVLEGATNSGDFILINLPLAHGSETMAFVAFLGGFSAAASMVVVSSVALATVVQNYLVLPTFFKLFGEKMPIGPLLWAKRMAIFLIIFLGYFFYRAIGDSHTLVSTGLLSFSAVFQLAPAVLLGLYWKGMKRAGALTGVVLGVGVWTYTLLLPSFARSGWMPKGFLANGPWGVEMLKPEALFGLTGFDPWSHSLLWSLVLNLGGAVLASLLLGGGEVPEEAVARGLVEREDMQKLLARFLGDAKSAEVMAGTDASSNPVGYVEAGERALAGAVGTVSAKAMIEGLATVPKGRAVEIIDVFGTVSSTIGEGRERLNRRVRELSVLYEASRVLSTSLDVDLIMEKVLRLIKDEFGLDHLAVMILDKRNNLIVRSKIGLDDDYADMVKVQPSQGDSFGRAFLEGKPQVFGDLSTVTGERHIDALKETLGVTALIHAPMIHERKSVGVLTAFSSKGPIRFTDEFVALFCALANQLGMAVVNAELYRQVHVYSQAMEEQVKKRTAQLEAANERLREIDRLKSEFLSNVSHELRTPLTSIKSFSEILLRYDVADKEKRDKFATIIHDEARRLTRMINDLLDLSRIEAGKLEVELSPVELGPAIERAVSATAPLFGEKSVGVEMKVEAGLPPVKAQEDRLLQVLTNLLGNAVKFAPGNSNVTIKARRRGAFALVAVSDQGSGIRPSKLREIFARYKQEKDPGGKHLLGTGLGLSISKDLVEMFGGYIWVESAPGEGATFYFTIPFYQE